MMSLPVFGIAVASYFLLHSLLAAETTKSLITRTVLPARYYRLFFSAFAVLSLAVLVWLFFRVEEKYLLESAMYLTFPGIGFIIAGAVWIIRAIYGYGFPEFIGIEQMRQGIPAKPRPLKTNGLNSRVRHPLNFGTLMFFWGVFLVWPCEAVLLFAAIMTVYIYIGTVLEERKLTQQYGEAYRLYQENVPRLIPVKFRGERKV